MRFLITPCHTCFAYFHVTHADIAATHSRRHIIDAATPLRYAFLPLFAFDAIRRYAAFFFAAPCYAADAFSDALFRLRCAILLDADAAIGLIHTAFSMLLRCCYADAYAFLQPLRCRCFYADHAADCYYAAAMLPLLYYLLPPLLLIMLFFATLDMLPLLLRYAFDMSTYHHSVILRLLATMLIYVLPLMRCFRYYCMPLPLFADAALFAAAIFITAATPCCFRMIFSRRC